MATVTHSFVSGIADDPVAAAAGEVLPSHWNANHVVTGVRTVLTSDTNFYVSTTGSDSNNGLTSGTAWATLQHAAFFIAENIDLAGFAANVNIGAGSFAGLGVAACTGGGRVRFLGAGMASTTITAGPNDGTYNFGECLGCNVSDCAPTEFVLHDVTLSNSGNGIFITTPIILSIDNLQFEAAQQGIGTFSPCIIFINKCFVPAGTWNLIYFFSLYTLAQYFDLTTFSGTPSINTVLQMEQYSLVENFGGGFTGSFTATATVQVQEWYSNTNFPVNTLGSISIGAGSLFIDPTCVVSTGYQFQQKDDASTGLNSLVANNWGAFKDFSQSSPYGNYFAANDTGSVVSVGKIGSFPSTGLPTTYHSGNSIHAGTEAWVTDATTSATFATTAVGGGTVLAPVYYDGTKWRFG